MYNIGSYFGNDLSPMGTDPYAQFQTQQGDPFGQIMLAFLSQNGLMDTATGMVDKAKFNKQINDTKQLQNQMDASTWQNLKSMADAWAR